MTTPHEPLRMPPHDAWIERREEFIQDSEVIRIGVTPGAQYTRIIGNLSGAWPQHGRVRYLPTTEGQITITEARLRLMPDGSVHAETT